ncbi:MAG: radical SAM protein [Polyangiaceae bacterium]|nr:radical SAM protein [Polyangiaceae bacterium]
MSAELLLNVAAVRPRTQTNGPGWRAAVWVQGCTLRCPGCFNPDTHTHDPRRLWSPETLADELMQEDVEGVTILGGEPFEQAAACARLAARTRALGRSVVTYSGYTAAYLQRSRIAGVEALLAATDLLIAGPYVAAKRNDGRGWHGSSNQEFVFLTDRYDERVYDQFDRVPVVEAWVDGRVAGWSGIPGDEQAVELTELVR